MQESFIDQLIKNYKTLKTHTTKLEEDLPALSVGLPFIFSLLFFILPSFSIILLLIFITITNKKKSLALFLIGVVWLFYTKPETISKRTLSGLAYIQYHPTKSKIYGFLEGEKFYYFHIPIPFKFTTQSNLEIGSYYTVSGSFFFNDSKFASIKKIKEIKYHHKIGEIENLRLKVRNFLIKNRSNIAEYKQGEDFLYACLFGFPIEKDIKTLFSKLGLSHILAISGFHFTLMALLFNKIFSIIIKDKFLKISLFIFLSFYLWIVGFSSSILRSYLMISLTILGLFLERKTSALNIFIASFIILFSLNPWQFYTIGCNLSFFATFGILTLYKPINQILDNLCPNRTLKEAMRFTFFNKLGYIFLQFFKDIITVNISAILPTIFLLFYSFKTVSILSFIYNLFIPVLTGIGMMLGCIGICIKILTSSDFLFQFTIIFLQNLIDSLKYYPRYFDYELTINNLNISTVIYMQTFIAIVSFCNKKRENQRFAQNNKKIKEN